MSFSFCLPFLFTLFRQELKKKTLHNRFTFNTNGLYIEHITKTNNMQEKK